MDWLSVTFWPEDRSLHVGAECWELLKSVMGAVAGEDAPPTRGYAHAVKFFLRRFGELVNVGRVDWGGEFHGGRARLELFGSGCSVVGDWRSVSSWLSCQVEPRITRVDLAVDFLEGEYSVEDACSWLEQGLFNCGGRNPRHSTPGDWLSPQPVHGRTLEIGRRENGKMLRAYEKGRQLGDPDSEWTRFEVEIRNNDREIPLDVLVRPSEYFAGAYKALAPLVDAGSERIATQQKEGEISSRVMVSHARSQYGQLVHVLRASLSAGEVLDCLSRPGVPRRLERSSLVGLSVAALKGVVP